MFFLFLIFFFFIKSSPLRAEILSARFELSFFPEKDLLQGKAQVLVDKEGFYTFSKKNLTILEIKQEEDLRIYPTEREDFFKIFIRDPKKPLLITFERRISLKKNPFLQIYEDYLPFPEKPTSFEILIKEYSKVKEFLILPYEEGNISDKEALFKIESPLKAPPPLVIGYKLREKVIDLNQKKFFLYGSSLISDKEWENLSKNVLGELARYEKEIFPLPYKSLYLFFHLEEKVLPLSIFLKKDYPEYFSTGAFWSLLTEEIFKYSLHLEDSPLLKALKLYFGPYKSAKDKIEFRKKLLLNSSQNSKFFFYLYETLENALGERAFDETFRNYYEKYLSNASSVKAPEDFLKEILKNEKINPENFEKLKLEIKNFEIFPVEEKKGYKLSFLLLQEGPFRPLKIKLKFLGKGFEKEELLFLEKRSDTFEYFLKEKPEEVLLDPEYKIFRSLSYEELSPTWETLKSGSFLVYLPKREFYSLYRELIENLRPNIKAIHYLQPDIENLPKENLLFFHSPPAGYHQYFPQEGFFFKILPHPFSSEHFIGFIKVDSTREIKHFLRLEESLRDYWEFHLKGKKILYKREREFLKKGIRIKVSPQTFSGIRPSKLETLEKILPELLASQVILIGENHEDYSHHLFQLEVLKALYQYYPQLAIGLEMVQIPFQKYLDEFTEGKLEERELLEKIEYYDRWRFDYPLYRDIFLFAKEKKIKMIALDLPTEIVKKVFKSGITNLTGDERLLLPELDLYRPEYRTFLEKVFQKHKFQDNQTNFEYFYQAQVLRDENMAEKIVEFLKKNPSHKMVVLVGKGHLEYGYGIPSSLKRRNFHNFKTIVLGEVEKIEPHLSDYWFLTIPVEYEPSPKLGVVLEEEKEKLKIKEVLKGSLAERAGIKEGDILLKADERDLKKISDLKLILTFKKKGDILKLTLLRNNEKSSIEIKIE